MRPGTRVNEGRRSMTAAKLEGAPDTKPNAKATGGGAQSLPARSLRARSSLRHLQDGVPLASAGPVFPSRKSNLTPLPGGVHGSVGNDPANSDEIHIQATLC